MTTLSLLTPSGRLTLGNLLGALRPMAERQTGAFYGVSDLHAMTTTHDPAVLRSSPVASMRVISSRVRSRRPTGSCAVVMACRSETP